MTDELKKVYKDASKMDRYYDNTTPCDLYRGLKKGSKVGLMVPTIFGFYRRNEPRLPDIFVTHKEKGFSPQFWEDDSLVTDSKSQRLTQKMVKEGDQYMVMGCRTMSGDFRGLSLFNTYSLKLPFNWFLISKDTEIPKGLAVTRDASLNKKGMVHYTVAPKDDMTLSLYLKQLEALGSKAITVKNK